MVAKISDIQRRVLAAGVARGTQPGVGINPAMVWTLKDGEKVTRTVNGLIDAGLMQVSQFGRVVWARTTTAGKSAARSATTQGPR